MIGLKYLWMGSKGLSFLFLVFGTFKSFAYANSRNSAAIPEFISRQQWPGGDTEAPGHNPTELISSFSGAEEAPVLVLST